MVASAAAQGGVWAPTRRRLTVGLVLAVTLVAFEALSVATILPVVGRQLGGIDLYGWAFSAFLLASLIGIVVAGALADRVAVAWPMLAGLALFALGLVIDGGAPSMAALVAGRAVQGLGAGAVPATAYVAIGRAYPDAARPRMFAIMSTAWVVPGLVGPALAAAVATAVGWRWVFLGLLPVVGCAGLLAAAAMRSVPEPSGDAGAPMSLLATLGAVAGGGLVLSGLTAGRWWLALPGVAAGGGLLVVSLRRLTPARTLLAGAGLPATVLSRGLLTFCFFGGDAYVPYALTTVRPAPTLLAGAALTASTITWTAGSWIQARSITRRGPRRLVRAGEVLVLVALGLMVAVLDPSVPPALGVPVWAVAGLGMGLAYAPLSVTVLDRAPAGQEGRATAGLQLTDVLGQALGTGVAGALVAAGANGLGLRPGVTLAFAAAATVGVVGVLVAPRLPSRLIGARSAAISP